MLYVKDFLSMLIMCIMFPQVKFMSCDGMKEDAVDDGGPRWELLNLVKEERKKLDSKVLEGKIM